MCILIRKDVVVQESASVRHNNSRLEAQRIIVKLMCFHLHVLNVYNSQENVQYDVFNLYLTQLGQHRIISGNFNAHHFIWSRLGTGNNTSGNSLARILANDDRLCFLTPKGLVTYIGFVDNHKSTLDLCFVSPELMVGQHVPRVQISQVTRLSRDSYKSKTKGV